MYHYFKYAKLLHQEQQQKKRKYLLLCLIVFENRQQDEIDKIKLRSKQNKTQEMFLGKKATENTKTQ